MKKFFVAALMAVMSLGVNAQEGIRVWYGAGIANLSYDGAKSEFKVLNVGVDYTAAINDQFNWTAGAGYITKGAKEWDPGYLQVEANGSWNFVKEDAFKVGLFTGPYVGFMLAKDDAEEENSFDFGWQAGVQGYYRNISLKVGYEYGFLDTFDGGDSKPSQVFFRVGYTF